MAKAKKEKTSPVAPLDTFDDKNKAVAMAVEQICKKYGEGAIMPLSGTKCNVEAMSTGSLMLDNALGVGGVPRGRIIELYGPESAGKTTVCLTIVAEEQKKGGICAFIDVEHAIDPVYAKSIGVDIESLLISQPDNGEQAIEIAEMLINSCGVSLIVIDSVAALVPKAEIEGDFSDQGMAMQARLMSKAMRTLAPIANKTKCTIVFTNQVREKVGIVYGNPEVTPGGRALKFFASVRMEIRKKETIKDTNKEEIGIRSKITVKKNKVASPFRVAEFDIMFGTGIDNLGEIADVAVDMDIIHKAGAWFKYKDENIAQGRDKLKIHLRDNPDLLEEITELVKQRMTEHPNNIIEATTVVDNPDNDGFDVE